MGDTFNLWIITEGSIPDMSSLLQAKTSWFSLRNAVSVYCTDRLARVLILVVHLGLELSRRSSSSPSMGSATIRCSSIHIVCK